MNRRKPMRRVRAFTLIELMVAVSIIVLLIALLIPGFRAVRNNAKNVATQGSFNTISQGLEQYRAEQALGGAYPPSQTDQRATGRRAAPLIMANPFDPTGGGTVDAIAGANLLVYGLAGADQLGTPGFPDLSDPPDGKWSDDQRSNINGDGAYELDANTREPKKPRYPGNGATYVDDKMRASIRTLNQLANDGRLADQNAPALGLRGVAEQPFFTDGFAQPILYYRANRAATRCINTPDLRGTYDQVDNAVFTGSSVITGRWADGLDMGAGIIDPGRQYYSLIARTTEKGIDPDPAKDDLTSDAFANTFEQYIHDKSVTVRNMSVNRETYLLIGAGADAAFGTSDDVTNWARE